jgi:hypothetical protein
MGYWVKIVTREEKPPNWPNILYMNSGKRILDVADHSSFYINGSILHKSFL